MYDKLYEMLEKIYLYKKKEDGRNNRLGFPEHRGCVVEFPRICPLAAQI